MSTVRLARRVKSGLALPLTPQEEAWRLRKAQAELYEAVGRQKRGLLFSNFAGRGSDAPYGAVRKPYDTPPFGLLRGVAAKSTIDGMLIRTRLEQVKTVARRVIVPGRQKGLRVVHERFDDPTFNNDDPTIQRRCREVEEVLVNPYHRVHTTFRDFLATAVEEELVLDRVACIIARNYQKKPVRLHLVPGDTVLPIEAVLYPWMQAKRITNERTARLVLSEQHSIDMTGAAYIQEVDGKIVEAWKPHEIDVSITNRSVELNRHLYGRSVLEQSLEATDMWLKMWMFNKDNFRPGYPEAILLLKGDYDDEGLESFKRQVLGEGDQTQAQRLPVLATGNEEAAGEVLKLRESMKEMAFAEFITFVTKIKCVYYRIHPSTIFISGDSPAANMFQGERTTNQVIQDVEEEGFHAQLESLADWLTRIVVKPWYPDLVCIWDGLVTENEQVRLANLAAQMQWSTVNEVRQRDNLAPRHDGEVITNPIWFQAKQAELQQQLAQQQQQAYTQGDFGQSPDGQQPPGQPGQQPGQPAPVQQPMQQPIPPQGQAAAGQPLSFDRGHPGMAQQDEGLPDAGQMGAMAPGANGGG